MKVAIVILNWNGKKLLEQFLQSVVSYSKEADIYIADNASTDDSINFIRSKFPTVKTIINKSNFGFALGYNEALKKIDADLFCLLNNDVEVTSQWLTPILDIFRTEPNTAIVQPKILNYHNRNEFDHAGAAGGFIDKFGFPYCRGRIFETLETDHGQYNDISKIFWASGACLFIRKSVYDRLNGFDGSFFAHMEEIDLCWRANNLGFEVKYIGTSSVYHVGGATLKNSDPRKTYLNFRNSLFMLTKNLPSNFFIINMNLRLTLDGLAAFKFLFSLKPRHFFAVLRSHLSFYWNLKRLLNQRRALQKSRNYYQKRSIVWSYFVQGKKFFNR